MICPNCRTQNNDSSKFCIKCGNNLTAYKQTFISNDNQNINNISEQQVIQSENYNIPAQANSYGPTPQNSPLNYLMYILAILLKPVQCFKEEKSKLNAPKTVLILLLITTLTMTVANLIKTMVTTVRISSYSWLSGSSSSWDWSLLKNINYLEVIGKNFLIYAGIILVIAIVFYLASLIIKKELNFIKSLAISVTSIIPIVAGYFIIAPLLGIVWAPLSIIFIISSFMYSLLILYELMDSELKLENDHKIYFYFICFVVLIITAYFVFTNMIMGSAYNLDNLWGAN